MQNLMDVQLFYVAGRTDGWWIDFRVWKVLQKTLIPDWQASPETGAWIHVSILMMTEHRTVFYFRIILETVDIVLYFPGSPKRTKDRWKIRMTGNCTYIFLDNFCFKLLRIGTLFKKLNDSLSVGMISLQLDLPLVTIIEFH